MWLRASDWYKWEVRAERRKERQAHIRRALRLQGTAMERCDRYRWGGMRKREKAGGGGWRRETRKLGVSARRLNADFNAGPRSTHIVNFPPCLLELSLTRRRTDQSDRTLRHRRLQQTATNLILISHLRSNFRHITISGQVPCQLLTLNAADK